MKDLSRIDRQMETVIKQINPLKKELSEARKKEEGLKSELDQVNVIMEKKMNELRNQHNVQLYKCKEVGVYSSD